jgi:rhodanese-related sulfurtransferase
LEVRIYPPGYTLNHRGRRAEMFGRQKTAQVKPPEAVEMQRRGAVLLDVREDDEWDAGHVPGAVHLPLGRVAEVVHRFRGEEVLTLCRSGARSGLAAKALAAGGVNVHNVQGGMRSWLQAGLPVVRDDGSPGTVA